MSDTPSRPGEPGPQPSVPPRRPADSGSEPVPVDSGHPRTVVRGRAATPGPEATGPQRIGDYAVLKKIGEGGMGAVYLAEDHRLGRKVAIKTMHPALAARKADRDRFAREARTAAAVEHDNIVPIWYVGEDADGTPFIAMPFLQGEPLDQRLQRERVAPLGLILKVARDVAEGLAAAHAAGLMHRDIKPANVWLEGDPSSPEPDKRVRRCRVLDFGLARSVEKDDAQITASGAILGTPAYMAPEQARGAKVDHRADLFGLGVTLYRMATGEMPFKGETALAVLTALATDTPASVSELAPRLPIKLAALIDRLMAKDPDGRPQSAEEVAEAVRRVEATAARPLDLPGDEGTEPEPRSRKAREPEPRRRSRLPLAAGVGAILLACAAVAVAVTQFGRAPEKDTDTGAVAKKETPRPPTEKGKEPAQEPAQEPPPKEPPKTDKAPPLPTPVPVDPVPSEPAKQPADAPAAKPWPPKELVATVGDERFRHGNRVHALAASADGKWLATSTQGGPGQNVLHLWDAATGKEVARAAAAGFCMSIAFSPDAKRLAVVEGGLSVVLWDIAGGKLRAGPSLRQFAPPGQVAPVNNHYDHVAFAPDGKELLAWSKRGWVWVWSMTPKGPREHSVHPALPREPKATFSAGCRMLAWCETDQGTRKRHLWVKRLDEPKGVEVGECVEEVGSLSLSDDGKALAAAAGRVLRVWEQAGAAWRERPEVPMRGTFHVGRFSPDGRFLACPEWGSGGPPLWVVPVREEKSRPVELPQSSVYDPALVWLGGDTAVTCGTDLALRAWVPKGGGFVARDDWYAGFAGPVRSVGWRGDGESLVTVSRLVEAPDRATATSALTVWPVKAPGKPVPVPLKNGWYGDAAFLPDKAVLACGAERADPKSAFQQRGFLRRYGSATGTPAGELLFNQPATAFEQSADGRLLAALVGNRYERSVQFCRASPLQRIGDPIKLPGLSLIALSADGKTLAAAGSAQGRDGVIRLWNVSQIEAGEPRELGQPLKFGQNLSPQGLAFSPDGKLLATPTNTGLQVWDLVTGRARASAAARPNGKVQAVAWSSDGRVVATASSDGAAALWNAATLEKVAEWTLPAPASALAFRPDGQRLAAGTATGVVYVLDVEAILKGVK